MSSAKSPVAEVNVNEFAGRFLDSLVRQAPGQNVVCSPFSAWLPLAALANVTQPSMRGSLFQAIGCRDDAAVEDVNAAAASFLASLGAGGSVPVPVTYDDGIQMIELQPSGQRSLRLANSLWAHRGSTPDPVFVRVFADDFDGAVQTMDFNDPAAAATINRWVAENTDGLITDLFDHIDPEWAVVIANAIYFRGVWERQFDRDHTQSGTFHAPDGDRTAQFMRFGPDIPGWWDPSDRLQRVDSTEWMNYYEDEQMQMVVLPFTTLTERLAILLPTQGTPEALLTDLSRLESAWRHVLPTRGELSLPRFRLEADLDLSGTLASLGVPLFDEASSPLADLLPDTQPVWLSKVQQRVILDVDERGTTAAAATYGAVAGGCEVERNEERFTMVCDRPFAVALVGSAYYKEPILFCGIVNQPE
ncbi:MAG: serpin family protein [Propionibacteriaceae bacterium]|nr:serpin family protein [Propionibacteriaceae bacterium]